MELFDCFKNIVTENIQDATDSIFVKNKFLWQFNKIHMKKKKMIVNQWTLTHNEPYLVIYHKNKK